MYSCALCNYQAKLKPNYDRHVKTKKHLNNMSKNQKELEIQNKTLQQDTIISNQKIKYTEETINFMQKRIDVLENVNNSYMNRISSLTSQNESLIEQNK